MQHNKRRAQIGLESLEERATPNACVAAQAALVLPGLYASAQVSTSQTSQQSSQASATAAAGAQATSQQSTTSTQATSPLTAQQLATQLSAPAAHSLSVQQGLHSQLGVDLTAYQQATAQGSTATAAQQAQAKDQLFIDLGGEEAVSALAQAQLPQTYQAATDLATNNALTGSQGVGVTVGLLEATQDTSQVAQIATQDGTYIINLFPNG